MLACADVELHEQHFVVLATRGYVNGQLQNCKLERDLKTLRGFGYRLPQHLQQSVQMLDSTRFSRPAGESREGLRPSPAVW